MSGTLLFAYAVLGVASSHHERLIKPRGRADGKKPHIMFVLLDDYGWANAGWHRPEGFDEVQTPNLDSLVSEGIELDRHYVYKYCSPTRSAIQSGRNPIHVNVVNEEPTRYNPNDPVSGFAAIPRNMTGIAAKMAAGGYSTHMFGKWDAGMATPDHTPKGRGYQSSMIYFHHANNYWDQTVGMCNQSRIVDLWHSSQEGFEGPAVGFNTTCANPNTITGDGCKEGPLGDHWYHGYEDAIMEEQILSLVESHNTSVPLFLFWAPHMVHTPLQVPESFMSKFDFIKEKGNDLQRQERQTYAAMVNFIDEAIGNVTTMLKVKGMWEDTLMVFTADNGGPVYYSGDGGANNYPLRGGKMGNFEGGIRANAFVSGGYLPEKAQGTKYEGFVTGWDWYATFSELAGVDPMDARAAAAGLPPIDSLSMVDVLMGRNYTSPREEIPIGTAHCRDTESEPGSTSDCRMPPRYHNFSVGGVIRSDGLKIMVGDHSQVECKNIRVVYYIYIYIYIILYIYIYFHRCACFCFLLAGWLARSVLSQQNYCTYQVF
ncbi:hypothetical protein AAMO2058_000238900 [Amorphochlora amoebiformis]